MVQSLHERLACIARVPPAGVQASCRQRHVCCLARHATHGTKTDPPMPTQKPGPTQRAGVLELEQDARFQHLEWIIQRLGWVLIALAVVAALLGVFGGGGPLATAVLHGGGAVPLRVELDRVGRWRSPGRLRIELTPSAPGEAEVRVSRAYLDDVRIEQITPQPKRVESAGEDLRYVFDVAAPPLVLTFHLTFERWGRLHGHVAGGGGSDVRFSQLVYP